MAKKAGFEVVATKPVCVDFRDGRSVSYQPGQRFTAAMTNTSVLRLLRVKEIRKLSKFEAMPPEPVKLGAPRRVQSVLKRRQEIEAARRAAAAKLAASKKAPAKPEPVVDLSSPIKKKKTTKKKTTTSKASDQRSTERTSEDK